MTSFDDLNFALDELVDGVAYDLRNGDDPQSGINMTVALYARQPRRAAELLGAALLRLAEQHNAEATP